jgi:hypothetical protein
MTDQCKNFSTLSVEGQLARVCHGSRAHGGRDNHVVCTYSVRNS